MLISKGISNLYRYFTSQDLRELFTLDDPGKSKTQLQLNKMHAKHRKSDEELDQHISFLHTLGENDKLLSLAINE